LISLSAQIRSNGLIIVIFVAGATCYLIIAKRIFKCVFVVLVVRKILKRVVYLLIVVRQVIKQLLFQIIQINKTVSLRDQTTTDIGVQAVSSCMCYASRCCSCCTRFWEITFFCLNKNKRNG